MRRVVVAAAAALLLPLMVVPASAQSDVEEIGVHLTAPSGPLDPGRCYQEVYAVWPQVPGAIGYSIEYFDSHPEINRDDSRAAGPATNESPPDRQQAIPNKLLTGVYARCEDAVGHPLFTPGRFDVHRATVTLPSGRPNAVISHSSDFDTVSLDGTASTAGPNATISGYTWHFGDGTSQEGATATHTYANAGTYTVTLVVADSQGRADVAVQDVTVDQALQVTASAVEVTPPAITIDEAGSVDAVDLATTYTVTNFGAEALSGITVTLDDGMDAVGHESAQTLHRNRVQDAMVDVADPRRQQDGLTAGPFDLAAGASRQVRVSATGHAEGDFPLLLTATADGGQSATASAVAQIDGPGAAVSWTVPDRTVLPEPGEPATQHANFNGYVNPASYPMDLQVSPTSLCDQDVTFTIDGEPHDAVGSEPCDFTIELPAEGDYQLGMRVDGAVRVTQEVTIDDLLIAVVGDSFASGEGNPDLTVTANTAPQWLDERCHRSYRSGHVLAAAELEADDVQTSVTLAHMACSGASIEQGLLGPQRQQNLTGQVTLNYDQLQFLDTAIGDRTIDRMLLSIGANDIYFGPLIWYCLSHELCHRTSIVFETPVPASLFNVPAIVPGPSTSFEGDLGTVSVPSRVRTSYTNLCRGATAGATSLDVLGVGDADGTFEAHLNFDEEDFTGNQPPGPSATTQEIDILARPTQVVTCENLTDFDDPGRTIPLASPIAEDHPATYTITGVPTPSTELIGLQPKRVLEERMRDELLPELGQRYDLLADRLDDLVDPDRVMILDYFDPGDLGAGECDELIRLTPDVPNLPGRAVVGEEVAWASRSMQAGLNRQIAAAADRHGWTRVDDVDDAFAGHPMCVDDRFVLTVPDSIAAQGTPTGAVHPNAAGHAVTAERILAALDREGRPSVRGGVGGGGLVRGLEAAQPVPALMEPARPGDVALEAADLDADVGDVLMIDGQGASEYRTITSTAPLTVDEPLEERHMAGARLAVVSRIPPDPEGPDEGRPLPADLADALPERTVLTGGDTVDVAIEWTQRTHPDDPAGGAPAGTAGHVLLGRADSFADSLAAASAQGRGGMPLLLTGRDALDARTLAELTRLQTTVVHVLGGAAAVSDVVVQDLLGRGLTVYRHAGPTRIETALQIAGAFHPMTDEVVIARAFGEGTAGFADSLAAGVLAARLGAPVLLAPQTLGTSTLDYLRSAGVRTVHLAGGAAAISDGVEQQLTSAGFAVQRHAGEGRAETAVQIAEVIGDVHAMLLIDGGADTGWADGFAAARWAALHGAPVVLSTQSGLPPVTQGFLDEHPVPLTCAASSAAVCP